MSKISLRVVVPGAAPVDVEADAITLDGADGTFTVLPGHATMLARLKPGLMVVEAGGQERTTALGAGVCEVADDSVLVLAERRVDEGEWIKRQAELALEQAAAALEPLSGPADEGWARAVAEGEWADAVGELTDR
jgi:F-type H+-transporting ATPase subunit epsilon